MTKQVISDQGHHGALETIFLGQGCVAVGETTLSIRVLAPAPHFTPAPFSLLLHRTLHPSHTYLTAHCYMHWELIWPLGI